MEVKRAYNRKPKVTDEQPKQEVVQPVTVQAPEPQKIKPTIVVRAQPIVSTPQMVQRQSNQVILQNTKTGKRTPMGRVQAVKMANKYPKEFKVL